MKVTKSIDFDPIQAFKFGSWPFGKPSMYVHTYFIDGLLIDTGHSNMQKEIIACLRPLPIQQIFITHHHEDHNGNLKSLQQHFDCPTYAYPLCVDIMKQPPSITLAQWLTWGTTEANTNIIPLSEVISTPNYSFQIIHTPGHAADMVCLYEASQGWLFSADLYVHDYIRFCMRAESVGQQIRSIKKVLRLDFDKLFCSHNPQMKAPKERLKVKLQFLEDFYGKVSTLHHKGYTPNAIFNDLRLKEAWQVRLLSGGELSAMNMVRSVVLDEEAMKLVFE